MGDGKYRDTAQAHTSCCVLAIAADDFQAVLQDHPSVALAMLEYMARRLDAAREVTRQLASAPVESRIASLLLRLGERLGEPHDGSLLLQLPLSRQDLAEMTGATIETVSRVMSQLRKQGIIRSGRGWVAIADRARLARVAEEN
jgi:CRP-like cAMP-binding protein